MKHHNLRLGDFYCKGRPALHVIGLALGLGVAVWFHASSLAVASGIWPTPNTGTIADMLTCGIGFNDYSNPARQEGC